MNIPECPICAAELEATVAELRVLEEWIARYAQDSALWAQLTIANNHLAAVAERMAELE